MELASAIRAAAHDAPDTAIAGLEQAEVQIAPQGALGNLLRGANMIGQCAHESVGFTRLSESLFYTTPERLLAVFPRYFHDAAQAAEYVRNAEKLANYVYGNRMGNGPPASGDGYRYRGRGYLQLTGRENYRKFGSRLGLDLEADPEGAMEPATAWLIAASYLATRSWHGKTALEWADDNNVEAVTRIVNGGLNGLADRRHRTSLALAALEGDQVLATLRPGDEGGLVERLQHALSARGFSPGALDGDFGAATENAVKAFQAANGLGNDGVVGANTWAALAPLPG
ncbi:MAG: peptidoglycan-binding protein [Proteobacteria bacterium]|nr:peptidoglycan-binding protein [Pseudomonadota bacterium]